MKETMNIVHKIRNRMANQLGIERTPEQVEHELVCVLILEQLVQGVDWSWLRNAKTPGQLLVAAQRMKGILDDPSLSLEEFLKIRDIILAIDERVNPMSDGSVPPT